MSNAQRVVLSRGFQVALVLLPFVVLSGFDHVWSGAGGNANFSNNQNWATPTAPVAGEAPPVNLFFPAVTPTPITAIPLNQDVNGLAVDSLSFDGTAYSMGGLALNANGPITVGPNSIFDDHLINVPITLTGDLSTNVTGPNAGLIFNGVLSGPFNVVTGGAGYTVFNAPNTFSGTTTIQSGTLILGNPSGFGSPTGGGVFLSGGLHLGGLAVDPAKTVTLNPGGSIVTTSGASSLGSVNVVGPGIANLILFSGTTLDIQHLGGSGPLSLTGGGVLSTSSDNGFSGTMSVFANTTFLANSPLALGTVSLVDPTAKVGGSGPIGTLVVGAGTVSPGNSPGILSIGGNATFTNTGTCAYTAELNGTTAGTGYDSLAVTGNVNLGSGTVLNLTRAFAYAMNDTLDIVTGASITGTFAGLPDNATLSVGGQMFRINYLANSVRLTALAPVPVTLQEFTAE